MWEMLTAEEPYANMHCGAIIGTFHHTKMMVSSFFFIIYHFCSIDVLDSILSHCCIPKVVNRRTHMQTSLINLEPTNLLLRLQISEYKRS